MTLDIDLSIEERVRLLAEDLEALKQRLPTRNIFRMGSTLPWENPLRTPNGIIDGRHLKIGSITADSLVAGSITTSLLNVSQFIVEGATWTDNSPGAGSVAWSGATVYFRGTAYVITNGNTASEYIWWSSTTSNTTFQSSNTRPTLTDAEFLIATNNAGLHDLSWNAVGNLGVNPGHLNFDAMASLFIYGDGVDGNVTISADTHLTRDMAYDNLTINAGKILYPDGYRIFVKTTLTNNGTIRSNGTAGAAIAEGTGAPAGNMGGGANGGHGANKGTPVGAVPGSDLTNSVGVGGGAGGNGTDGTYGTGQAGGVITITRANRHGLMLLGDSAEIRGGTGGGGGGANNGVGDSGGGGGGGGGVIIVAARTIANGSGTIEAKGGAGGGAASGGGGGGGGGGAIVLIYRTISSGTLNVAGGALGGGVGGGANGNAGGTGLQLLIQQEA